MSLDVLPTTDILEGLLEMLYPDLPLVDILTLADFKFRYRFSGLGAGAVAAMERAQRVTRAIGNYDQMGLTEFHNGLIYLHERQYLGAQPYFAEARRYWDFADRLPAVCLAYFAQGIAQQGAFHFERALSAYGKADKCMAQFPVDDAGGELGAFWQALKAHLAACRENLLQQMRRMNDVGPDQPARRLVLETEPPPPPPPPPPPGPTALVVGDDGEQPTPYISPGQAQRPSPPTPTPPPTSRPATADLPIFNLAPAAAPSASTEIDREAPTQPEPMGEETAATTTPIPAHQNDDASLIWMKPDPANWQEVLAFLPNLQVDAYVLVDKRVTNYIFRQDDLVIVDDRGGEGIVPVQPSTTGRDAGPIFLGKIDEPPGTEAAAGQAAPPGTVKLSPNMEKPLFADDIIGIVIGIWFGIDVRQRFMEGG